MNKKINPDLNSLKFLYDRYKDFIIPIFVILFSLFLFIKFVIPQFQGLIASKQEIKNAYDKLNIAKNNLSMLTFMSEPSLDNNVGLLTKALPAVKDFDGILNALSIASTKAGVTLGNFSFQVGDLSTFTNASGYLSLKLNLNVSGGMNTVSNFLNILNSTLPLSEVKSIEMNNKSSIISLVFYYKPLPPIAYSDSQLLKNISKNDLMLIEKLFSFNNSQVIVPSVVESSPISSKSSSINPF